MILGPPLPPRNGKRHTLYTECFFQCPLIRRNSLKKHIIIDVSCVVNAKVRLHTDILYDYRELKRALSVCVLRMRRKEN